VIGYGFAPLAEIALHGPVLARHLSAALARTVHIWRSSSHLRNYRPLGN
jgi:hypothetical protein